MEIKQILQNRIYNGFKPLELMHICLFINRPIVPPYSLTPSL